MRSLNNQHWYCEKILNNIKKMSTKEWVKLFDHKIVPSQLSG